MQQAIFAHIGADEGTRPGGQVIGNKAHQSEGTLLSPGINENVLALVVGSQENGLGTVAGQPTAHGFRVAHSQAAGGGVGGPGTQHLGQRFVGLNTAPGIDVEAGTAGNGFKYGQVHRPASAGPVEVDEVQTAQAGIGEALSYGHGVRIVSGLAGKVAGAEPDALPVDKVDGGNDFHEANRKKED